MVQKLKEKKLDPSSLIGGWYIPTEICDELVNYFNFNKKYLKQGKVAKQNSLVEEDKNIKDSFDLNVSSGNYDVVIGEYRKCLKNVLDNYLEKYKFCNDVYFFDIKESFNIQYYPIGGGFKKWHCENTGDEVFLKRHLVFMTYLNDVEDGGTEFYYQGIKTKAEKGLTLIWPAIWTHTHRGAVSNTKEKIIVTGWYSFLDTKEKQ